MTSSANQDGEEVDITLIESPDAPPEQVTVPPDDPSGDADDSQAPDS